MKKLNNAIFILAMTSLILHSCVSQPMGEFSKQDFMFIRPFNRLDTVIFTSTKGQFDTIIFHPAEIDTVKRRSFELGFYNAYVMGVEYELTHGSIHCRRYILDGKVLYGTTPEVFYSVNISTKEYSGKELSFFDLKYGEDSLKRIYVDTTSIISFNGDGKGNGRGINSFTFSPNIGIISYIDTGGIKWVRHINLQQKVD